MRRRHSEQDTRTQLTLIDLDLNWCELEVLFTPAAASALKFPTQILKIRMRLVRIGTEQHLILELNKHTYGFAHNSARV